MQIVSLQVPAKHVFSVPAATPEVVAMLTSGLTASIGLEVVSSLILSPKRPVFNIMLF